MNGNRQQLTQSRGPRRVCLADAGFCVMKSAAPALDEGPQADAAAAGRLKSLRRSKLYDLFAAASLIAWYLLCAEQILPSLIQQFALALP